LGRRYPGHVRLRQHQQPRQHPRCPRHPDRHALCDDPHPRDLYTVTGRIGYLFTPQLLGYVKGGGAWTNTYTTIYGNLPVNFLSESASADRQGWTVGGGLEYMFAKGWSVFGEYNYADLGRKDITFTQGPNTVGVPTINSTRLTMQTALVGVNYKFNFAGPVVAKY
jgi:outer membrane immunogenic protein